MKDFISDAIRRTKLLGALDFCKGASRLEDCISLGIGEPDFITPWHITEEGVYSLEKGRTFYTSNQGLIELRRKISRWNKGRYGLEYSEEEIVVTCGGSEAIDISLRACIDPGDEVLIPDPGYVSYAPEVELAGGTVKRLRLTVNNGFRLTKDVLKAAITPKTKILILNYPNNPTGAIMRKEDLQDLVETIIRHDLLVISDEVYSEFTYGDKHVSIGSLPGMRERTIVINDFSKAFGMTGWRLGYAMGPKDIIDQVKKIHQFVIMSAPTISQYAGLEAMKNGDRDIERILAEYNRRRNFVLGKLASLQLPCYESEGAFYVFPNISRFGLSGEEFALKLLEEERVIVVPGTAFGESGEGFVRISYSCDLSVLKTAMERLERFLKNLEAIVR